jgi:DNA end-binding protein Ku
MASASWKGHLQLAYIVCPVALYPATGEADKVNFNLINRKTGNKISKQTVDAVTGDLVDNDDVAKAIKVAEGKYVEITQDEIDGEAPQSKQVIEIDAFVAPADIDPVLADRTYYLAPDGEAAVTAFALIAKAIKAKRVAALAQLTLGTREHLISITARGPGLAVTTLRYPLEVKDEAEVFTRIGKPELDRDWIEAAQTVVAARTGPFDPAAYEDRYAAALADLVRTKIAGKMVKPRTPPIPPRMTDLAEAVRRSRETTPAKRRSTAA